MLCPRPIPINRKRRFTDIHPSKRIKHDINEVDTRHGQKDNQIRCMEDRKQYRISFKNEKDVSYDTIDNQFIITINELDNIFPLKHGNLQKIDIRNEDKDVIIQIPKI